MKPLLRNVHWNLNTQQKIQLIHFIHIWTFPQTHLSLIIIPPYLVFAFFPLHGAPKRCP